MAEKFPSQDFVSWVFGNTEVSEEQPILIDASQPTRVLTKSDVRSKVRRYITGLRSLNNNDYLHGTVVCLDSFNSIEYPLLVLAIIGAGGCFTGVNPGYGASELVHHFRVSESAIIITELGQLSRVEEAAGRCHIADDKIFVIDSDERSLERHPGLNDLTGEYETPWLEFDDEVLSQNTVAALLSTSGTSGLPKMAMRTHKNMVVESVVLDESRGKPYDASRLMCCPLFHAFALPLCPGRALREGVATYIMRRFELTQFLHLVEAYSITETALVPPVIIKFVSMESKNQKGLRSLRLVWCGGAPLDSSVQAKACSLFAPDARITQVWGMTECGWITTFLYPEKDCSGSVGRPVIGYESRVVDDHGVAVGNEGEHGEIVVRGPMTMLGYRNDPQGTATIIDEDGWLSTGDIGFIQGGKVYIVDRKKELIKVKGWQVAPAELEGVLLKHPSIIDCAVIGKMAEDRSSEIPRAYITSARGVDLREQDVRDFLLHHLARYKVSDCEVIFRDEIPKSPSGKILRKILRQEAAQEEVQNLMPRATAHKQESYRRLDWVITLFTTPRRILSLAHRGMRSLGIRLTQNISVKSRLQSLASSFVHLCKT